MKLPRRTALLALCALSATLASTGLQPLISEAAPQAGTTYSVEGTTVTITVRFALCCVTDAVQRDSVLKSVQSAQNAWNGALAQKLSKGCYQVHVMFQAEVEPSPTFKSGYHDISLDFDHPGRSSTSDPGTRDPNKDTHTAYAQDLNGDFYPTSMSDRDWGHEIGHLMGLGDDYTLEEVTVAHGYLTLTVPVPLPGRKGTLMSDHGDIIDQPLVDRIGSILAGIKSGEKLPQCWSGLVHSESVSDVPGYPNANCHETWNTKFTAGVGANGQIRGKGRGTVAGYGCADPRYAGGQATFEDFNVTGHFDGQTFMLTFVNTASDGGTSGLFNYAFFLPSGGAPVIKASVTSTGVAQGTTHVALQLNRATVTATHETSMTCVESC